MNAASEKPKDEASVEEAPAAEAEAEAIDASATPLDEPAADAEATEKEGDEPGWFEVEGGHPNGKSSLTDTVYAKNKQDARGKFLQDKPVEWDTTSIKRTKTPKDAA